MDQQYRFSIPKPCHEDWNKMHPKDKGKFCNSCAKTVIDFSKMSQTEVQDFMNAHKGQSICGRFNQEQLRSINIQIPFQNLNFKSFRSSFIIALLITMGTTLMNCTNRQGQTQKIDSIDVVDTKTDTIVDILGGIDRYTETDSIIPVDTLKTQPTHCPPIATTVKSVQTQGEVIEIVGIIAPGPDKDGPLSVYEVDQLPQFPNTPKGLTTTEQKDVFNAKLRAHIMEHIAVPQQDLGLSGKQRIYVKFNISKTGNVEKLQIRAPHKILEDITRNAIGKLPTFSPGQNFGEKVPVSFTLPILIDMDTSD